MKRIQDNQKPPTILKLGNNKYYYNYNIEEKEYIDENNNLGNMYSYIQVKLSGIPNYSDCIKAVIREYISSDEELSLINKYNSYQNGIINDPSICSEYLNYCKLVAEIKENVKKDFGISSSSEDLDLSPTISDMTNLLKVLISTTSLTDSQSLLCKSLYPTWKSCIGKSLKTGDKIIHKGVLYKVRQNINTVLENQEPSIYTASLYEEINESHDGTIDDPIPYNNNMELIQGKYYIQDGIVYLCSRGTGQAVCNPLKDLVGLYVTIVE